MINHYVFIDIICTIIFILPDLLYVRPLEDHYGCLSMIVMLLFQGYVSLKLTISMSWNVCKNKKTSNNEIGCFHFMSQGLVQLYNTVPPRREWAWL